MKDDNCIFCKLANGEIPAYSLYEDDDFNVIFDAGPASPGHALVIPKDHAKDVFRLDDELVARAHILAKKVACVLTESFEADGVNILQNNAPAAGQSVFHYHIHVIPRHDGDNAFKAWTPGEQNKELLESKLPEIQRKLKNF